MAEPAAHDDEVTAVVCVHDLLVRDLVAAVLGDADVGVTVLAGSAVELLDTARRHRPSVVVTDLQLGGEPVERVLPQVLSTGAKVVVLGDGAPRADLLAALLSGASGQLLVAETTPARLVRSVRSVAAGDAALNPEVAAAILEQWRQSRAEQAPRVTAAALSSRETEILAAVAEGLTTRAIARRFDLSPKTVENHKARVYAKLGVKTQAHAVSVALERGLIEPPA